MDAQDLRDRLREDFESASWPVLLTALPIAIVLGFAHGAVFGNSAAVFLFLVIVGVLVPHAYEEFWLADADAGAGSEGDAGTEDDAGDRDGAQAGDRPWMDDVAWTARASVVAAALFVVTYLLVSLLLGNTTATAVIAFLLTLAGGWWLLRELRDAASTPSRSDTS